MSKPTIIIVGAGIGGISACYHLSERLKEESLRIVCFDDESPLAASRDEYKIVRYDYADIRTMEQALESYNMWQTNPDFSKFFRKRARLVIYKQQDGTYEHIKANRAALGLAERQVLLPLEVFQDYRLQFAKDALIILNEDDALVKLDDCMKSMRDTCEQRGIEFINKHMEKINFNNNHFSGVTVSGCEIEYPRGKVVVSPGASFPQLREKSNMQIPPRMSTCVQIFAFDIQLRSPFICPFVISEPGIGEFFKRDEDHVKLTWIQKYARIAPVDDSKTFLALQCLLHATQWFRSTAPDVIDFKIARILSYADGLIPGENPMIARLPTDSNTVVVHGLSYTNAKRLPDIGLEIMSVMNGTERHLFHGWGSIQSPQHHDNQPLLRPRGTFENLNEQAKLDPEVIRWQKKHPTWREGHDILS